MTVGRAEVMMTLNEHESYGTKRITATFDVIDADNEEERRLYDYEMDEEQKCLPDIALDSFPYSYGEGLIGYDSLECHAHKPNAARMLRVAKVMQRLDKAVGKQELATQDRSFQTSIVALCKALKIKRIRYSNLKKYQEGRRHQWETIHVAGCRPRLDKIVGEFLANYGFKKETA